MKTLLQVMAVIALIIGALATLNAARTQERPDREFRECSDCPQMVAVPAGSFVMGSPASERGRFDSEGPQHAVTVRAFALGKYDVTIEEFLIFLRETGYQPLPCDEILRIQWQSYGHGLAYAPVTTEPPLWPAHCLNWNDAQAYIAWLNHKVRALPSAAGRRSGPYRLPSEAEWEYAARAGTTTARWWGEGVGVGNADCNGCGSKWDGELLAPAGSFGPNSFGLYDMLGNVWQWVNDCWNENYAEAPRDGSSATIGDCTRRVLRGGSWSNLPSFVRSAARSKAEADGGDSDYSNYAGFRVARTLP